MLQVNYLDYRYNDMLLNAIFLYKSPKDNIATKCLILNFEHKHKTRRYKYIHYASDWTGCKILRDMIKNGEI